MRAAATLGLAITAAALAAGGAGVDAVRGLLCLGPALLFDRVVLGLQLAAAGMLGAALALEARRQRRAAEGDPQMDRMMTLAVLGCAGLALAAFLVSLRLGACAAV